MIKNSQKSWNIKKCPENIENVDKCSKLWKLVLITLGSHVLKCQRFRKIQRIIENVVSKVLKILENVDKFHKSFIIVQWNMHKHVEMSNANIVQEILKIMINAKNYEDSVLLMKSERKCWKCCLECTRNVFKC